MWKPILQKWNGSRWVTHNDTAPVAHAAASPNGLRSWCFYSLAPYTYVNVYWVDSNNNPADEICFKGLNRGYYRLIQNMNWQTYPNSMRRSYQLFGGTYQNCDIG